MRFVSPFRFASFGGSSREFLVGFAGLIFMDFWRGSGILQPSLLLHSRRLGAGAAQLQGRRLAVAGL
ncbi:hypothetical protein TIFTF001_033754 [Ficus carica]|uniref:Uncharacterized protein n=1 Tax=Ficus carica TaxID=3494 RepID=A0AA88J9M4_FICCA|nr:hypothetical protein TIFTF001_033754 [Ficus carica]